LGVSFTVADIVSLDMIWVQQNNIQLV